MLCLWDLSHAAESYIANAVLSQNKCVGAFYRPSHNNSSFNQFKDDGLVHIVIWAIIYGNNLVFKMMLFNSVHLTITCLVLLQVILVASDGDTAMVPSTAGFDKIFRTKLTKFKAMGMVLGKIQVCHNRYKQCTKLLPAHFCASANGSKAFYLWARRMGTKIMEGQEDDFKVKCTPSFIKAITHGPLSRFVGMSARIGKNQ